MVVRFRSHFYPVLLLLLERFQSVHDPFPLLQAYAKGHNFVIFQDSKSSPVEVNVLVVVCHKSYQILVCGDATRQCQQAEFEDICVGCSRWARLVSVRTLQNAMSAIEKPTKVP